MRCLLSVVPCRRRLSVNCYVTCAVCWLLFSVCDCCLPIVVLFVRRVLRVAWCVLVVDACRLLRMLLSVECWLLFVV